MGLPETYVESFHDRASVEKMEYSKLGNTSMNMSKIGIGGAAFSSFYSDVVDSEVADTIEFGLKSGINYIDTAPLYGGGQSEIVIGKALKAKSIPRESFYITTKVGRFGPGWENLDYSKERVQKSVDDSLERLGLSYIDIILVHDVEFATKQVIDETLPAMQELVDQGKVKHIGISGYPLDAIWKVISTSTVNIEVVLTYARDTLTDSSLNDYITRFKERGVGVITASPTGCQLLTNKGPEKWHPASEKIRNVCSKAAVYCKGENVELATLAMYHALSSPNTSVCLVGNTTIQILKDNLNLLFNGPTPHEVKTLGNLKKLYFNSKENLHWEGVEIEAYNNYLKSVGK